MIRSIHLIFSPGTAWPKIAQAKRGTMLLVLTTLLPLALLASVAEGYAALHYGAQPIHFGKPIELSQEAVLRYESLLFLVRCVLAFVVGLFLKWIGEGFHFQPKWQGCFSLGLYGLTPLFWASLLHFVPGANTWLIWGIGLLGCIYVLYQGVGCILEPDQTKGFGLYIMMSIVFVFLTGLAQVVQLMVLAGRFANQ